MAVKVATCRTEGLKHEPPMLALCEADLLPPTKKRQKLEETIKLPKQHFSKSLSRAGYNFPLKIVRAWGQYMYSEEGVEYLDMRNNVHHVGHSHPKVVDACVKQMSLLNTNSRFLHDNIVKLAQRLAESLPGDLSCCFFVNSGSEANDLALQIAETASGGTEIITVNGAYHGHLKSLKAITSHPLSGPDTADYAHIISLPDVYRGKYKDPSTAGKLYANELKEVIDQCHAKDKKVAAFICESIPCCAGQIILPNGYLKAAFEHVRSAGGLCIADEVQSGFGRVGSHFWAFELQGVCPDIVTIGKPMGNGHPVSAVITTKAIAEKFSACGIEYFNTFGGNPVSMAVSLAVLDVIEQENLPQNALNVGTYLLDKLRVLQIHHQCIGDVRGVGLMVGIEFVKSRETLEPDADIAAEIKERLASEHHILTLTDGLDDNVIKIKPPLCITNENVDHFIICLDAILNSFN